MLAIFSNYLVLKFYQKVLLVLPCPVKSESVRSRLKSTSTDIDELTRWKYNIDPALLAAITEEESGVSGPSYAFSNRNNAMGISPNDGGPRNFGSVDDSINYAARILSNPNGAYASDYTIGQLWLTYSPPGANNDPNDTNKGWGPAVANFYTNLKTKTRGGG
jgi:hypothetical protein